MWKSYASMLAVLLVLSNFPSASNSVGLNNFNGRVIPLSTSLPTPVVTNRSKPMNLLARVDFVFVAPMDTDWNSKAWTAQERACVIDILGSVRRLAPGLQSRVTAYTPLRLQRLKMISRDGALALASQSNNTLYFSDRAFASANPVELKRRVIHEFSVLADLGYHLSSSDAWSNACSARMHFLKQNLAQRGVKISAQGMPERQLAELDAKYSLLANGVGLPDIRSATNEQECLASCLQNYLEGFRPPVEIKNYLDSELLSLPYRPRVDLKIMHEAISAGTLAQSISLLNELIERDSIIKGYALWARAGCYAKQKNYKQAVNDYGESVKCFYNTPRIQDAVYKKFLETCVEAGKNANSNLVKKN